MEIKSRMPVIFLSQNPQFNPLSEVVSLCRLYGFGIEVAAFSDIAVLNDDQQVPLYKSALSGINARAIHAPYLELYPGSPDKNIREETFACFQRIYKVASHLDAAHIIFHHNYDPSMCSEPEWLGNSCAFWQKYLEENSSGIKIHLENILDKNPELLSELVRRIGSPLLDIALDIGHAHAYSRVSLLNWVELLKTQIGYVHLHDNHGLEDEHLALGDGNISLIETFDALCNHAPAAIWSLESGGDRMYRSIAWLKANGYPENMSG